MYGATDPEKGDSAFPLISIQQPARSTPASNTSNPATSSIDATNPFNEKFDSDFWKKVAVCFRRENERREVLRKNSSEGNDEITWHEVTTKLRLERIKTEYEGSDDNKDILVYLITVFYDSFMETLKVNNAYELKDSFIKQISEFVILLLEEDYDGRPKFQINDDDKSVNDEIDKDDDKKQPKRTDYDRKYFGVKSLPSDPTGETRRTILHIAGERNLCDIAKVFLKLYPTSICVKDEPKKPNRKRMAVEYALDGFNGDKNLGDDGNNDEVCSILMKAMLNERVRLLFQGSVPSSPARYRFGDIVKNSNMKKTVLCVLDACINPNFPYQHEDPKMVTEREERGEESWSKVPGIPLQYNFFFQILDGDVDGKPARIYDGVTDREGRENTDFLHCSPSALQVIANNATTNRTEDEPQDPIKHIAVRQLVRQKWDNYGSFTIKYNYSSSRQHNSQTSLMEVVHFGMYLLFLITLAIALFLGAMSKDPSKYPKGEDKLRAVCEIITLLFTFFYIGAELEQLIKEYQIYIYDKYNIIDLLGLTLIVILMPCRYADAITVTRSISVAAYFINVIRIFKFFPAFEEYAIYAKTFEQIIITDIKKFVVIFTVVMMAFAGSVYIALIASNSLDESFKDFLDVFLQELRALTEGKEFADSYPYQIVLTLFILLNMAAIIVILSNILIGQLSYRYETAQGEAKLQFDIDKAKLVTSLERSWFKRWNKRIKYYKDGMFVSDKDMISDLLVFWSKQSTDSDATEDAIRSMLNKRILKKD